MSNDLDWLATAEAKPAPAFKASKRGRQAGTNPMDVHVRKAYENGGKPLQLSVPAGSAKKAERLMRRSALRLSYSLSVQVWDADGNVIPLKAIDDIPEGTDVTLVFAATEPTEKPSKTSEKSEKNESPSATEDPFASAPNANGAPVTDEKPKGRKSVVAAAK